MTVSTSMSSTANTSPDVGKRPAKPRTSGTVGAVGTRPDKKGGSGRSGDSGCSGRKGRPGRSPAPVRGAQSHATLEARFRKAVTLYRDTTLSMAEIARRTGVSYQGLRNQLYRYHRELLLARHGIEVARPSATEETDAKQGCPTPREVKLRGERGQTPAAQKKYGAAIQACDDLQYIALNISQIARMFGLSPTALGNQLHAHYPDVLERRERERQLRGLSGWHRRGARPESVAQYAPAVGMLRGGTVTVREAARACGVSAAGLYEHLLFYHRDIVERCAAARAAVREDSRSASRGSARDTTRKAAREAV